MKVLIRGSSPDVTILRVIPDFEKEYSEYVEVFKEEIHRLRKLGVPKSVTESLDRGKEILENLREAEEGNYNIIGC